MMTVLHNSNIVAEQGLIIVECRSFIVGIANRASNYRLHNTQILDWQNTLMGFIKFR